MRKSYLSAMQVCLTKMNDNMATRLSNGMMITDQRATHGIMEVNDQNTRFMEMFYDTEANKFDIRSTRSITNVADYFIAEMEIRTLEKAVIEASKLI